MQKSGVTHKHQKDWKKSMIFNISAHGWPLLKKTLSLGKLWPGEHSTMWKWFGDPKWAENLKCHLFIASVKYLLLYGSEFRTLTSTEEGTFNGCHTLMLHMTLGVSWKEHLTNLEFLDNQLRVSDKKRVRILEVVWHCKRHSELAANPLILWEPT
jgi:hypothetical protein